MDAMGAQIGANNNNVELMKNLNKITPMLQKQGMMMNPEAMSNDLRQYQTAMDNIEVAGKIMNSDLNSMDNNVSTENSVDTMMAQLKQELAMDIGNNLSKNPDLIFNKVKESQQQQVANLGNR